MYFKCVSPVLYIAKDISPLKRIEQQLISKNQELDTFVYKVSHDLKGPLSSILGITSLVEDEIKDQAALNYFKLIKKCSESLDTILKNLLDLALMERMRKEKSKICFNQFIKNITDIYSLSPHSHKNHIRITVAQKRDFFNNEKMLHSVIQNLVDNAVKYRKPGQSAEIDIAVTENKNGVIIIIKDNGIGIREDLHDKIFNMFYRGPHTSEGSGLGLYMAKSYIEKMGGEISFLSTENIGTEFIITLPCLKNNK
ncbi:HAMP domain-containing sensor histidine kinase [Cytophagaceae bacterium ABcell3]|nr:HAMP domain-containing sensor histidine kinase [Cytophagaceae bacterium ABcell3]